MARFALPSLILASGLMANAAWAAPGSAAQSVRAAAWSPDHPIGLGARVSGWGGNYAAPGLGGHLKLRPWSWLGIEAFNDNFAMLDNNVWRHDHVIGFSLYAPSLIGNESWFIAPTFGMCVDFKFAHPNDSDAPSASAIEFGMHAGAMAEVFVMHGFSFELNASIYGYLGNETELTRWSATRSNDMSVVPVFLASAGVNYYF